MKFLIPLIIWTSNASATDYSCYAADCIFEKDNCSMGDVKSQPGVRGRLSVGEEQSATFTYTNFPNRLVNGKVFNFTGHREKRIFFRLDINRHWWAWFDISKERPINFTGDWSEDRNIFFAIKLKLEEPIEEFFICVAD